MIPDHVKKLIVALTKLVPPGETSLVELERAVAALNSSTRAELLKHGAARPTARTDELVTALARLPTAAFDQLSDSDKDAVWAFLIYALILPPGARTAVEMFGPNG